MRTVFSSRALRRPAAARKSSRTSVLVMVVEEDLFDISRSPLRGASSSDLHPTPGSLEINFSAESRSYARTETRDSRQIKLLAQLCAGLGKEPAFPQLAPAPLNGLAAPLLRRFPRPRLRRAGPRPNPCRGSAADPSPRAARSSRARPRAP